MKKLTLISLSILLSVSLWAQKYPAIVKMIDGRELQGEIKYPESTAKEVEFYPSDTGKKSKIPSGEIAGMRVTFKSGNTAEMEYIPMVNVRDGFKDKAEQKIGHYAWQEVLVRGFASLYCYQYEATGGGATGVSVKPGMANYYCYRQDKAGATLIFMYSPSMAGKDNMFIKTMELYFSDDAQLVEKIRKKEKGFTWENIVEVVQYYNSRHNKTR